MSESFLETVKLATRQRQLAPQTTRFLKDLQANLPHDVVKHTTGMHYGAEAKYVSVHFEPGQVKSLGTLELLHITDVQFGHVECNYERVIEYRDWVLSKPNRFMLWGGDMIDATNVLAPGSPWENLVDSQSQVYRFVETWAPARHRVLGFVGGNHERRGVRTFGDLGLILAVLLRIPYSSGKQFVDIHFGEHKPFKVSLWHGRGAARTAGAKMQMLHRFMNEGDSQLYLVGHLHDALTKFDWRLLRRPGQNNIQLKKIGGAMSSSFLSHFNTYAEVAGLTPSDVLMARTILESNGCWELTLR